MENFDADYCEAEAGRGPVSGRAGLVGLVEFQAFIKDLARVGRAAA